MCIARVLACDDCTPLCAGFSGVNVYVCKQTTEPGGRVSDVAVVVFEGARGAEGGGGGRDEGQLRKSGNRRVHPAEVGE